MSDQPFKPMVNLGTITIREFAEHLPLAPGEVISFDIVPEDRELFERMIEETAVDETASRRAGDGQR